MTNGLGGRGIKETTPFTTVTNNIKHSYNSNQTSEKNCMSRNFKSLKKETKKYIGRYKKKSAMLMDQWD